MLEWKTKLVAVIISVVLLVVVIELVRRRKLREEYSFLWLLTAGVILILGVWFDALMFITKLIGAKAASSALFFLGVIFLIVINLHFSVQITKFRHQIKLLTQKLALLESQLESKKFKNNDKP